MNRIEFVPQTKFNTTSTDVPSTAAPRIISYTRHMNVELTVERVAGNWAATGEGNGWAENASKRDSAHGEAAHACRTIAVLWREDGFTVPLRQAGEASQVIETKLESTHEVQL